MKKIVQGFGMIRFIFFLSSCNQVVYIPKSKKEIRKETPSSILFERIVEFRVQENSWPVSTADFMSKDKRYFEVLKDFPYQNMEFKIKDSNRMTFYFSNHVKVDKLFNTQKPDLNDYSGSAKFYKEQDKFIWKIKMN